MDEPIEREKRTGSTVTVPERRRPGRASYTNPFLIALLRQPAPPDAGSRRAPTPTADDAADQLSESEPDGLAAARGIGLAAIVGAALWAGVAIGLWLLLGR